MRLKKYLFYFVIGLIILLLIVFLYTHKGKVLRILSPFLLAIPLTYIVKPVAHKLAAKKIPISFSILSVYLVFLLLLAAFGVFFIPELADNIRELMETLPELMAEYEHIFNNILSSIRTSNWSDDIKSAIFSEIENKTASVQKILIGILENGLSIIVDIVRIFIDLTIAMIITYYIIKDSDRFRDYALSLLPRRWRNGIAGLGKEINRILEGFIQGQLLTAFILGIMEILGLMLIRLKYPLVLGMLGGIGNVIPYFGPFIGVIPALAVALTISPMKAVWTVVVFIAAQQIDNNFISPKIIEGKLGLHPVATIFAVLVGGEFFGILGMLLAVPVMAILRAVINKIVEAIV